MNSRLVPELYSCIKDGRVAKSLTRDMMACGLGGLNPHALTVGALSLAIILLQPRLTKKIPGSIVTIAYGLNAAVTLFTVLYYLHNKLFNPKNPMRDLMPGKETDGFANQD